MKRQCILPRLVILDPWLVGLHTPLLDFQDLRSSVQPFAAGSTLPVWPAWQNADRSTAKLNFCTLWSHFFPLSIFIFFYECTSFRLWTTILSWKNPDCKVPSLFLEPFFFLLLTFSFSRSSTFSTFFLRSGWWYLTGDRNERFEANHFHKNDLHLSQPFRNSTIFNSGWELLDDFAHLAECPLFPPAVC